MRVIQHSAIDRISPILHINIKTIHSDMDMVNKIREGFLSIAFNDVCKELEVSQAELSRSLGLQLRTLARRKMSKNLTAGESDRLYRLVRIYVFAIEVLQNKKSAVVWLKTPNFALGGKIPLDLFDTDVGTKEVEHLLGRIQHGIFA